QENPGLQPPGSRSALRSHPLLHEWPLGVRADESQPDKSLADVGIGAFRPDGVPEYVTHRECPDSARSPAHACGSIGWMDFGVLPAEPASGPLDWPEEGPAERRRAGHPRSQSGRLFLDGPGWRRLQPFDRRKDAAGTQREPALLPSATG